MANKETKQSSLPSPREFMRGRRPEEFSDSTPTSEPLLDRVQLEYHLHTLTSRSQEVLFENFARRLAQHEICPNLIPHTGPTGGGDSKVDSETFPVAEELALAWFQGAQEAAGERWAFAFSAKVAWKPKVRADIRKLASTKRGYKKAFFVTNQFVADKQRADIEDKLRRECNLDVRVFDRSWILDRVFTNKRENLAIEELGLTPTIRADVRKGPNDVARAAELAAAETRVRAAVEASHLTPTIVDDCLHAADLSAALDLPRVETDGRFQRAQRLAELHGTKHQQLQVAYQWAWRSYFWFEDAKACIALYKRVEALAIGTDNVYELELLGNLWHVLLVPTLDGRIAKEEWAAQEHLVMLKKECERLANDKHRPSSELQARMHLVLLKLMQPRPGPDVSDEVAEGLAEIVKQATNLIGFPMGRIAELILELGESIRDSEKFEQLVQLVAEVSATRAGDVVGAKILFKRAAQLMTLRKPYEALRTIGPALPKLYKFETRQLMLRALWLTGSAYQDVGLIWAARGAYLLAASIAANEFWRKDEITPEQAVGYNKLKWLELQLGRIPQALAWHELDRMARAILVAKGHDRETLNEGEQSFDSVLGILFLKSELSVLRECEKLYTTLEDLGLFVAPWALLHALGHSDPELADFLLSTSRTADEWFLLLRDQPAASEIPGHVEHDAGFKLRSIILGCRVTVSAELDGASVEVAESFIAGLEAFLATAIRNGISPHQASLIVQVVRRNDIGALVKCSLQDNNGVQSLNILVNDDVKTHLMTLAQQSSIKDALQDGIVKAFASCFFVGEKEDLEQLVAQDRALERALNFAMSLACIGNILGKSPKFSFEDWHGTSTYVCARSKRWDSGLIAPARPWNDDIEATGLDLERVKHSDIEHTSIINLPLWDRAQWDGIAFLYDSSGVPVLGPIFHDRDAAEEIFKQWEDQFGHSDIEDKVRVAIIKGVSRRNVQAYRVVIGSDPMSSAASGRIRLFQLVVRVHTMEPVSSRNLDAFLEQYGRAREFVLTPSVVVRASGEPDFQSDRYLLKKNLHVRWAWEIGENDIDSVAIRPTDDPIVPASVEDPPVATLLKRKREATKSGE